MTLSDDGADDPDPKLPDFVLDYFYSVCHFLLTGDATCEVHYALKHTAHCSTNRALGALCLAEPWANSCAGDSSYTCRESSRVKQSQIVSNSKAPE